MFAPRAGEQIVGNREQGRFDARLLELGRRAPERRRELLERQRGLAQVPLRPPHRQQPVKFGAQRPGPEQIVRPIEQRASVKIDEHGAAQTAVHVRRTAGVELAEVFVDRFRPAQQRGRDMRR